jgi:hypothetical protein
VVSGGTSELGGHGGREWASGSSQNFGVDVDGEPNLIAVWAKCPTHGVHRRHRRPLVCLGSFAHDSVVDDERQRSAEVGFNGACSDVGEAFAHLQNHGLDRHLAGTVTLIDGCG